jgi:ligand-binding sensor domain-containing protein
LFLVFNVSCFLLSAQPFTSKTFSTANGLTHNYVQSIAQDKTGFLWIATWDGISRFDGYEFRNYHHRPNDLTTFSFFAADKIVVDLLNDVWVLCTLKPLYRFNKANDNFERFNLVDDNTFSDITMDTKGDIWLLDKERLFHYSILRLKLSYLSDLQQNN